MILENLTLILVRIIYVSYEGMWAKAQIVAQGIEGEVFLHCMGLKGLYLRGSEPMVGDRRKGFAPPNKGEEVFVWGIGCPSVSGGAPQVEGWLFAESVRKIRASAQKASETLALKAEKAIAREKKRKATVAASQRPASNKQNGKKKGKQKVA